MKISGSRLNPSNSINFDLFSTTRFSIISAESAVNNAATLFKDPLTTEVAPLDEFYKAEVYHQDYFTNNPNAPYCTFIIDPKIKKLQEKGTIWDD